MNTSEDGGSTAVGSVGVGLRTIVSSPSEILLPVEPTSAQIFEIDEAPLIGVSARCSPEATNGVRLHRSKARPSEAFQTVLQFYANNLPDRALPYFTVSLILNSAKQFPVCILD